MSVEATTRDPVGSEWRGLVRLGAAAAVFVVVMIPLQAAVFILRPPPSTVEGFSSCSRRTRCSGSSTSTSS
jgi:hypothetical protein